MADKYKLNLDISGTNTWLAIWWLSRCMKAAGWTYKASSDGSTMDTTGVATNDKWGGNADPMLDTAPVWTTAGWWVCEGVPVLKVPISAAPTGTFVRGENVKQAVSAAEGEILGVVIDSAGTTGFLVILPRVGTFNSTNIITGDTSGATSTPSATILKYVHQIVFWKGNATNLQGTIYCQCVEDSGENASKFSVIAASASVGVAPGGAASQFPTPGSYVVIGTGNATGHANWSRNSSTTGYGKAQVYATNVTAGSGVSADGTFWVAYANPNINSGAYGILGFFRCDDNEDGDLTPFVWYCPQTSIALYAATRLTNTTDTTTSENSYVAHNPTYSHFRGWRRRGFASADTFVDYQPFVKGNFSGFMKVNLNVADREMVACDLQSRYVGGPIFMENANTSQKQTKGTLRWARVMQGGASDDTYASKKWIQLSHQNAAYVIGPWDGSTTPIFS